MKNLDNLYNLTEKENIKVKKKDFEDENDFVEDDKVGLGIKILIILVIIVFLVGLFLFIKSFM